MMGKIFSGDVISYEGRENVDERIVEGIPATFSLCIGAAVIWMFFGILFGYLSAVRAGGLLDRVADDRRRRRHLDPGLLARRDPAQLPHLQDRNLPLRRLRRADRRPARMGLPPDPALGHAGDPLRRPLQPRAALQHARRDERGLRAHGAGQGAERAAGDDPPRAAQLADPDRHPLRPRLRRPARRRDPDRSDLQPQRRRPVRLRIARSTLDLPPIMAIVLFGAFFVVLFNALVDIAYAYLDPRIRLGTRGAMSPCALPYAISAPEGC